MELHTLGAELSLSTRVVTVSDALAELADRSPDTSPHRVDEPYRRAISGIFARVAATLASIDGHAVTPAPVGKSLPYHSAYELKVDLDVIHKSLCEHGSRILARGRLRRLRRAIDCFGFHLASIDLRQNSAVHERTVAELLEVATPGIGYTALAENRRVELLLANSQRRARLFHRFSPTRPRPAPNWQSFDKRSTLAPRMAKILCAPA